MFYLPCYLNIFKRIKQKQEAKVNNGDKIKFKIAEFLSSLKLISTTKKKLSNYSFLMVISFTLL